MAQPTNRHDHWEKVYDAGPDTAASWFQARPEISLGLIRNCNVGPATRLVDIGCGTSRLVDELLNIGLQFITLLDVSSKALELVRTRLAGRDGGVSFVACDIVEWQPSERYQVWHDRAALHFLTDPGERAAYLERLNTVLEPGGYCIIGSFAMNGPERCSGLPVQRYSAESMQQFLGSEYELLEQRQENHITPSGKVQAFHFFRFKRRAVPG